MATRDTIYRVVGDSGPDLFTTLVDTDISAMTISVVVRYANGGSITKPAIIDDAENGQFHIEWDLMDLMEGAHSLEYVIENLGDVRRLPTKSTIALIVRAQV